MANIVMILGASGTGKSTSIKSLNPEETVIINLLKKKLPFKGSSSMYNAEKKNMFNIDTYDKIIAYLKGIDEKMPNVKTIVLDDFTYEMRKEMFATAKQTGYSKFTDMAAHFQQIIQTMENMREDINVFIIMHCEEIVSDGSIVGYKASTVGKLVDSSYNPIEVVPMLLFSKVKYNEKGVPQYGFYTHRAMEGSIEIPAKSPDGMFDEDFIENDLQKVVDVMNEYYK